MRYSTLISLAVALVTASLAVVGVAVYLSKQEQTQQQRLVQQQAPVNQQKVVVARRQLLFGELIDAADVELLAWHAHTVPEGYFTELPTLFVVDAAGHPIERYALTNIQAGEPLHRQRVSEPGVQVKLSSALSHGRKAISIRVNDVLGVAGFVLPGDYVDVLSTRKAAAETRVDVILQDVKVLAVDQVADQQTDQPSVVRTVTFDVSIRQAQVLTLGASIGTLSLALRHLSDRQQSVAKPLLSAPSKVHQVAEKSKPSEPLVVPLAMTVVPPKVRRLATPSTVRVITGKGQVDSYQVPDLIIPTSIVPPANTTRRP